MKIACGRRWSAAYLRRHFLRAATLFLPALLLACGGAGSGEPVRVHVPVGASFGEVTDSLARYEIIKAPALFELYARIRGASRGVKPGTYGFRRGTSWGRVLADLNAGRVLNVRLVIPEAWDLRGIAPRIAEVTGLNADSILRVLFDTTVARKFGVPGPTLEGYL